MQENKFQPINTKNTTYNLGGKYSIARGNQSGSSKDYKTYDKRQPIDELRILSTASQLGCILNLTAWDP